MRVSWMIPALLASIAIAAPGPDTRRNIIPARSSTPEQALARLERRQTTQPAYGCDAGSTPGSGSCDCQQCIDVGTAACADTCPDPPPAEHCAANNASYDLGDPQCGIDCVGGHCDDIGIGAQYCIC
ncbi:MAG: mitochondrial aspartate-glutamate transporter agc1 [Chaenotheca gracillima]|nr:MAG: mitochondrial aspartate-glutamate transporter agc1 [Chaenotheca gracillima]